MDPHGVQGLQLWAEMDLQASIQPRQLSIGTQSKDRFAFIIDSQDFASATAAAVQKAANNQSRGYHAINHLVEVARSSPEIVVILDRHGHMSAWGLENVGGKVRKPTDVFNIAHVENFFLGFPESAAPAENNTQLVPLCFELLDPPFALLVHHFDGRIEWLGCRLDELFDPSPQQERVCEKWLWTGHDGSVKKIVRSTSGKAIISRTNDNNALIWKQRHGGSNLGLDLSSSLDCLEHIHRSWLLHDGDFVVNLHHRSISLWDARSSPAASVGCVPFDLEGQLICLVKLPEKHLDATALHVAAITAKKQGIVWEIKLPRRSNKSPESEDASPPCIGWFCTFTLDVREDLSFLSPVDPAGSALWTSSSLDTFAKDIAISYSSEGRLRSWTAALDINHMSVEWLSSSVVETGVENPSLASASSTRKAAVVDASKTGLTVWDIRSGQLEHKFQYGDFDLIQDLDWSATPDNQALLAVGFPHKVVVLAQMRYDYLSAGPAWAPVREIHIKDSTPHPIGDSTWLGSGNLVIGAGNQLFVYDKTADPADEMVSDIAVPIHRQGRMDLFDLVTLLNGPLPLFHPQFLSQCVLAGKLVQVHKIICRLHEALKYFTEGDDLDSFVSMTPEDLILESQVSLDGLPLILLLLTWAGILVCWTTRERSGTRQRS